MILRDYQAQAVESVYRFLRERDGGPVVVLPPGSGKSVVIAQIATDVVTLWSGRIVILAHMRELLEQNADKIRRLCPDISVGIFSAGMRRRDVDTPILVAGIQSVYQRACEIDAADIIAIDEVHLLPLHGMGMYQQFLRDMRIINPNVRVVGFTGTPYRLDSGPICAPDHFLTDICYSAGIKELIRDGYLSELVSRAGVTKVDTSQLRVRGGEFVSEEAEQMMDQDSVVEAACDEIVELTRDRKSVLIFSAGIRHGQHVQRVLQEQHPVEVGFVCGETPAAERDAILARFRGDAPKGLYDGSPLKYLVNAQLLTTGFDVPAIDCVVLLRPTMSPSLLVQMVGRALRLAPGKKNALILDFAGNIERHGPVDQIQPPASRDSGAGGDPPAKECPECHALIAAGYARCPECGHEFPEREKAKHEAEATDAGILSGQVTTNVFEVRDETYRVHTKRGAPEDAPKTMRVDYLIALDFCQSEFICLEHQGYARRKAEAWWHARCDLPVPSTAEEAVRLANEGMLRQAKTITVRHVAGEKFPTIVGYELRVPELEPTPLEEIPF